MSRKIVLTVALLLLLVISFSSSAGAMPTNTLTILPKDCQISAGEELSLTLEGRLPPNAVVSWDVNDGGITAVLPGLDAVFVAPGHPAVVTVTVSISSDVPGLETPITRQCIVTSSSSAPRGLG